MAITAALLGVFVVVRRMAFFTDAVSHASLTGVAIALLIGINPFIGALLMSVFIGFMVARLIRQGRQEMDTVIGVLFSAALALGVLLIGRLQGMRTDLMQYLFGDVLAVRSTDVWAAIVLLVATLFVGYFIFKQLTRMVVNEEMARIDGVRVNLVELLFLLLLAAVVAVGLKVVGVILMGALMILPAATAQYLTHSFRTMLGASVLLALFSMVVGLFLSAIFSTSSGPTVVLVASALFALAALRGIIINK